MNFVRQAKIFDPSIIAGLRFHFIGLGSAGSAALLAFAKLGVSRFVLWDSDDVAEENLPTQLLYNKKDLFRPKVEAAAQKIRQLNPKAEVVLNYRKCGKRSRLDGVVISGVDSITERRKVWEAVCRQQSRIGLYLDQRLAGEYVTLLSIEPISKEACVIYEEHLFDTKEAWVDPCGATGIIYPAMYQAALAASQLVRLVRGEPYYRCILGSLARGQDIQFLNLAEPAR